MQDTRCCRRLDRVRPLLSVSSGLVASGKVHGTVEIVDSFGLTHDDLEKHPEQHCVSDLSIIAYPSPAAWVMANPRRFQPPLPHLPCQGARMWINLEYPTLADRMRAALQRVSELETSNIEEVMKVCNDCGAMAFDKVKTPYLRVLDKPVNVNAKFYYDLTSNESLKQAAMRALTFKMRLAEFKDEVNCMQLPGLKQYLSDHQMPKTGPAPTLRDRVIEHMAGQISGDNLKTWKMECAQPPEAVAQGPKESAANQEKSSKKGKSAKEDKSSKSEQATEPMRGKMTCKFFALPSGEFRLLHVCLLYCNIVVH